MLADSKRSNFVSSQLLVSVKKVTKNLHKMLGNLDLGADESDDGEEFSPTGRN